MKLYILLSLLLLSSLAPIVFIPQLVMYLKYIGDDGVEVYGSKVVLEFKGIWSVDWDYLVVGMYQLEVILCCVVFYICFVLLVRQRWIRLLQKWKIGNFG